MSVSFNNSFQTEAFMILVKKKKSVLPVVSIFNLFLRDYMLILKVLNHRKKSISPHI